MGIRRGRIEGGGVRSVESGSDNVVLGLTRSVNVRERRVGWEG